MASRSLIIVESPAKTKTITKFVGPTFTVLATYGHLTDLPSNRGRSVHTDDDFKMDYEVTEDHVRHANAIVAEARRCDTIYLASDLDREGEAISWHVTRLLEERGVKGKTIHRITFSEITKKAVLEAIAQPRQLNLSLINAQQARRALDYLVGYNLSPVLWKKVKAGLSAGRVQSPALRMIVEREDEIDIFQPKEHWIVNALLSRQGIAFKAKLTQLDGKKYDPFSHDNAIAAKALETRLKDAAGGSLVVSKREAKERQRRPYAPFTTSTLQQDAANRLGFPSARTMRIAQSLYEGITLNGGEQVGLITYMRTDAVNLAEEAIQSIRSYIQSNHDPRYLPAQPVRYHAKSKNAQEAHEGIRPTSVARTPQAMAKVLDSDQLKLYTLIWQRAVACQMSPALFHVVSVDFEVPSTAVFHASGSTLTFPGFLSVYGAQQEDKEDDAKLPPMEEGDTVDVNDIVAEQKFTEPPPRFNEASLVKHLEELDIGRPSTYASIIETLKRREYVMMDGRKFVPTEVGRAVGHFLEKHFEPYVDYQFTSRLEDSLDAVARGEREWIPLLREFWEPFIAMVKDKTETASREDAKGRRCIGQHPVTGEPVYVFVGRFGGVIAIGDITNKEIKPKFTPLPEGLHVERVTLEDIADELRYPIDLGDGYSICKGQYGVYVKKDGQRASLEESQDPFSVTLDQARELVRARQEFLASRDIKDFGNGIKILNGKFGPYCDDGTTKASVPPGRGDPKDLTLDEVKAILEAKREHVKAGHGGGKKGKKGKWKGGGKGKGKGSFQKGAKGGSKASSIDGLPM